MKIMGEDILRKLDIIIKILGATLLKDTSMVGAVSGLHNVGLSKEDICLALSISEREFKSAKTATKQLGKIWRHLNED